MQSVADWLITAGDFLTRLGLFISPLSFIAYIFLSWFQYVTRRIHYTKAAKTAWYLAVGLGEIFGDERIYMLVVLMIFMDCTDSLFEFLEEKRALKEENET
ncbi:hypothetical protein GCM10008929_17560 [Alkalibacterium psychrotolerans]